MIQCARRFKSQNSSARGSFQKNLNLGKHVDRAFLFEAVKGTTPASTKTENKKTNTTQTQTMKAGESGNQRPKRRKEKLIRLDDLIPKQDVTGGHQLFGVTDTTNNP